MERLVYRNYDLGIPPIFYELVRVAAPCLLQAVARALQRLVRAVVVRLRLAVARAHAERPHAERAMRRVLVIVVVVVVTHRDHLGPGRGVGQRHCVSCSHVRSRTILNESALPRCSFSKRIKFHCQRRSISSSAAKKLRSGTDAGPPNR